MDFDSVAATVKSVITSSQGGLLLSRLSRDYEELAGEKLNYSQYGYSTLRAMLASIPGLSIRETSEGQRLEVHDPNTQHLNKLISNQKPHKPARKKTRKRYPYSNYSKPSSPQASRTNNLSRKSFPTNRYNQNQTRHYSTYQDAPKYSASNQDKFRFSASSQDSRFGAQSRQVQSRFSAPSQDASRCNRTNQLKSGNSTTSQDRFRSSTSYQDNSRFSTNHSTKFSEPSRYPSTSGQQNISRSSVPIIPQRSVRSSNSSSSGKYEKSLTGAETSNFRSSSRTSVLSSYSSDSFTAERQEKSLPPNTNRQASNTNLKSFSSDSWSSDSSDNEREKLRSVICGKGNLPKQTIQRPSNLNSFKKSATRSSWSSLSSENEEQTKRLRPKSPATTNSSWSDSSDGELTKSLPAKSSKNCEAGTSVRSAVENPPYPVLNGAERHFRTEPQLNNSIVHEDEGIGTDSYSEDGFNFAKQSTCKTLRKVELTELNGLSTLKITVDTSESDSWTEDKPTICGYELIGESQFAKLAKYCLDCRVEKRGKEIECGLCVSGQTIDECRARIKEHGEIASDVIVMLGVTDIIKGFSLGHMKRSMTELLKDLKSRNICTVILATLPVLPSIRGDINKLQTLKAYNSWLRTISSDSMGLQWFNVRTYTFDNDVDSSEVFYDGQEMWTEAACKVVVQSVVNVLL